MKHHNFIAASAAGDLLAQIRLARPAALDLILNGGIDGDRTHLEVIDELVGGRLKEPTYTMESAAHTDMWVDYCHHINAAFAIGIVIGQLVHPDVFKTGGSR
jgi:hypothetical protein